MPTTDGREETRYLYMNKNAPIIIDMFLCFISAVVCFPVFSVLRSAVLSHALLFGLSRVLLPVDSRDTGVHRIGGCQIGTGAPAGRGSAELEWRSECRGCGGGTCPLSCGRLLPDLAWVFPPR